MYKLASEKRHAGPELVQTPLRPKPRHSPLAMWHLLSLDAPSVAAVWTVFVAGSVGLRLPWVEPAAMFVAVWMIYAADRLLDGRGLEGVAGSMKQTPGGNDRKKNNDGLEKRHRFHLTHRGGFLVGIGVGAVALGYLLSPIDGQALRLYAVLAMLLGVWMLLVHMRGRDRGRLPKEIAVGLFFPAAVFIPTVARLPGLRFELLPGAALFAGVCALNCLMVYAWEHPGRRMGAHWTTRWATRYLDEVVLAMLLLCGGAAVRREVGLRVSLACGLSVGLLWGLHRMRGRIAAVHLRAAADLVLLTPLLWLRW
jgi:hypothetical protein